LLIQEHSDHILKLIEKQNVKLGFSNLVNH
jgi:hypothetical protein